MNSHCNGSFTVGVNMLQAFGISHNGPISFSEGYLSLCCIVVVIFFKFSWAWYTRFIMCSNDNKVSFLDTRQHQTQLMTTPKKRLLDQQKFFKQPRYPLSIAGYLSLVHNLPLCTPSTHYNPILDPDCGRKVQFIFNSTNGHSNTFVAA